MLKNFTVFKRKEVKAATHPTHDLVASDEKYENKVKVGSIWTRTTKDENGNDYKFLSGTLSKQNGEYDGYVIITEKEWNEYQSLKKGESVSNNIKVGGYTGEVSDTSSIDF